MNNTDLTQLLIAWRNGDEAALASLMPLVYDELRRLAERRLRRERADHSWRATELVHETYLKLLNWRNISWQNRAHFFAIAAQLMRNILVDRARNQQAEKRGGIQQKISIDDQPNLSQPVELDLVALDDALNSLALIDAQQSRIIELRYFGGLTIEETAEVLGISSATVKREWMMARAWLLRELSNGDKS
jgi:RNA polymerase sigma factor (TIGR02999 family)